MRYHTLTEAEFISGSLLFQSNMRNRNWIIFIGCSAAAVAAIAALAGYNSIAFIAMCALIGAVVGGLVTRLLLPRRLRKIHSQQASLHEPYLITWSEDGLTSTSARGSVTTPWTHFRGWCENADVLLLRHSDCLFQVVSKQMFESAAELQEFTGALAQRVEG